MFKDSKVLVTGGAGFIGSHLVDRFVDLGSDVIIVDNLSYGSKNNLNKKAEFLEFDLRDYDSVKSTLSKTQPDILYHLAAIATSKESEMGWKAPSLEHEVNATGTLNLLRASLEELTTLPRFIYASTAAVYGDIEYTPIDEKHPVNPISPYGVSKLAGEKYALAFQKEESIPVTAFRLFNIYGPRQPRYLMSDLLEKLKKNKEELELLGSGEQMRSYCYVSDAVDGFISATNKENAIGEVYNLAGENSITVKEVARTILDLLNLDETEIYCTGESWKGDIQKLVPDISKIKNELDFEPEVDLEKGLTELWEWYKEEAT